jgi:hypothetical protein
MTKGSSVAIAYVYCDYQDATTLSGDAILGSLTRQLAEQCPPVPLEVKAFRDKYSGKNARPSSEERISLLRLLAGHFQSTYVFIDAVVRT